METIKRKPFQGVFNVVKFNWHFYLLAILLCSILLASTLFISNKFHFIAVFLCCIIFFTTAISLIVTYYVYDYSKIYELQFLNKLQIQPNEIIVNINAGFDEFSFTIANKFKTENLHVFDFYNPEKHTEISIERARKVSTIYPNTKSIETSKLPLETNTADYVFLFFAAHEIRKTEERTVFLTEISRILKPNGKIIILEHLRDFPNFTAYTIGFFHFLSFKIWKNTFCSADLIISEESKITPFLSLFTLQKNGNPS